jgi:hypothetical protein
VLINLLIENDFIQEITQVKYINSLCSFEHRELEHNYMYVKIREGPCCAQFDGWLELMKNSFELKRSFYY